MQMLEVWFAYGFGMKMMAIYAAFIVAGVAWAEQVKHTLGILLSILLPAIVFLAAVFFYHQSQTSEMVWLGSAAMLILFGSVADRILAVILARLSEQK